jgi:glutamyl-tRNA synthetase/glutamyl-Q tRNA(Asp) synthetase
VVKTRFAPSPTGFLHLGHIVNAIYVWGHAQASRGHVLLRIEDHDRQRSRREYEEALLDDLDWLGFRPDMFPTDAFRRGRCEGRQSDREDVYRDALAPLVTQGLVFGCDCTRRQIEGAVYSGRCRERGLPLGDGIGWRVRLDPAAGGDVLIRDRLGNWTYQWCVSVDDTVQQITLVVRGEDLRDSTARQIALARVLGRIVPPAYVHHPLIMKSAMQKLSKSDGDSGIRELRAAGWSAARVIGHAAHLVGLQQAHRDVEASDVAQFFETPARVPS